MRACGSSPTRSDRGKAADEIEASEDHPSNLDQARRTFAHLAEHTTTPDHCYLCIWDGSHYDRLSVDSGPHVTVDLPIAATFCSRAR